MWQSRAALLAVRGHLVEEGSSELILQKPASSRPAACGTRACHGKVAEQVGPASPSVGTLPGMLQQVGHRLEVEVALPSLPAHRSGSRL